MEIHERAKLIADRLAGGQLPRTKSVQMWAGFGNGRPCDGCDERIGPTEVEHEHEVGDDATLRLHAVCSVLWQRMTAP
jgi:hypothetical protein